MTRKQVYNILVFLFFGGVFGLLIKYWHLFTFNFEVSVFDVIALISTVILAWWVAKKLERDSAVERCEKDILIEKLKQMEGLVENVGQKTSVPGIVQLTDVIASIDKFDKLSNRVLETIEQRFSNIINPNVDYRSDFEFLDNLCSNDQVEGFADNSIVMDEDDGVSTCIYSQERRDAIEQKTLEIIDRLFKLQLLMNRA